MTAKAFNITDAYDPQNELGKPELTCAIQNKQNKPNKHLSVINDRDLSESQKMKTKIESLIVRH